MLVMWYDALKSPTFPKFLLFELKLKIIPPFGFLWFKTFLRDSGLAELF